MDEASPPPEGWSPDIPVAKPPPLPAPSVTWGSVVRDSLSDLALALLALIGFVIAGAVVLAIVLIATGKRINGMPGFAQGPGVIVVATLAVGLPMLGFGYRRLGVNRRKGRPAPALMEGPVSPAVLRGVLGGLAAIVGSAIFVATARKLFGEVPDTLSFLRELKSGPVVTGLVVFAVSVFAPAYEEFFFRGVMFGSADAVSQTWTGAIVSACLFAAMHGSLVLFPFYAAFGLLMCWLLRTTRHIAAPIAAHMTLNGTACVLALVFAGRS
jgi:membrane protease YdiL (CAAX protease family)